MAKSPRAYRARWVVGPSRLVFLVLAFHGAEYLLEIKSVTHTQKEGSLLRQCGFTIRLVLVAYSALLLIAGVWGGVSGITYLLLVLQLVAIFGLLSPVPRCKPRIRRVVGLIAFIALFVVVLCGARQEVIPPRHGELLSVAGRRALPLGEIVPERDILIIATRFLPLIGGLSLSEASGLLSAISRLADSMDEERGRYTSPLISSVVGVSLFPDSQVLVLSSPESARSKRAVVFLHGTGGSISLLCWSISRAAASVNADTYCPSLAVLGMWGAERGREALRDLLAILRARGKSEIYLLGVSAGAVGAAELVRDFEPQLRGVALVSGAHPAISNTTLPVLFLYGKEDERFPAALLARIAKQTARGNGAVTIAEVDGDHLMALKRHERILSILSEWLGRVALGSNG